MTSAMYAPSASPTPPQTDWSSDPESVTLTGAWTVHSLRHVPDFRVPSGRTLQVISRISAFDSSAALVLARWLRQWRAAGISVDLTQFPERERTLLDLLDSRLEDTMPARAPRASPLARIGEAAVGQGEEAAHFLRFLGELFWRGLPLMATFWRIRWPAVMSEIEAAGVRALGIVGLLSFMIGMVMAYQGGATLSNYGANILIVNLVGIITLREMGPLLAAIIVAGRTGSSYTAQLGTMQITEEIDALRAIGIPPFELLVLPKVIALVVTLPLLSLFADLMGLLGGAVVANYGYGVSFAVYFDRIPQVITVTTLWLGLIKAPVFAVVIALIGCMQGLRVRGSAAEVGRATTVSVVQAIFMVIVIDAVFSVLYNLMGY